LTSDLVADAKLREGSLGMGEHEAKSILVVDDDADIRHSLTEILVDEGYAALTAGNGSEALSLIRANHAPSLIVLDLMMPVMDGYEFLAEQKRDEDLARIPVVVVTADVRKRPEELGVAAVVAKPFSVGELLEKIETYIAPTRVARNH
jgi:CheY-like chemotaxis protein